ncbi:hypothetical protein KX816_03070 [Sphingosinicellaceae bacterium]|nr:hypothetical protein KX816_03070 [Sphingosinicellaceae bacterium]
MIRFGSLIWGGATLAIMLGCYTVSLKASGERKAVTDLRREIASNERGIRTLQVEFRTRARLPELARWNEQVFGLQAATAQQLVNDPVKLANFEAPRPAAPAPQLAIAAAPAPAAAPLQTVAYTPAPTPAHTTASRLTTVASYVAAASDALPSAPGTATLQQVALRRVALR